MYPHPFFATFSCVKLGVTPSASLHLIVVAAPDDPLVQGPVQREEFLFVGGLGCAIASLIVPVIVLLQIKHDVGGGLNGLVDKARGSGHRFALVVRQRLQFWLVVV